MAGFPELSAADIAEFSGRPEEDYALSDYPEQALKQAKMLFKMGTCLTEFPDDEFSAELATYGILAMAEALILSQPYNAALANPFQSETIGSYSYSKMSGAVMTGVPTGVSWFDSAIQRLSKCGDSGIGGGGVNFGGIGMFEHQGEFAATPNGVRFLGPEDFNKDDVYPYYRQD